MSDTPQKPASLSAWKKAATHDITLPSGVMVKIKVPNLPVLLKAGALPNDLMEVATATVTAQALSEEMVKAIPDFQKFLVKESMVEPKVSDDDYEALPYEDIEMIADIATRQRDVDAVGHHLAGLEKIDDWRRFRGLLDGDTTGPGV